MNTEQQKQMREEFETWAKPRNYDVDKRHDDYWLERYGTPLNPYGDDTTNHCYQAWQTAYTPRPDVEVVARAIAKQGSGEWYKEGDEVGCRDLAQAAIDVIFKKENV